MIGRIFNNSGVSISEINHYADPYLANDMLDAIGSGMGLSDYKSHRIPESAKHCFDNIKLATQTGNGNIYIP